MDLEFFKGKYAIFDMDGLIVDSEPLWEQAQKKVLGQFGIEVTAELCEPLKGVKVDEGMQYWYNLFPWQGKSVEEVTAELIDEVYALLENIEPMPGVMQVLELFEHHGIPLALASSAQKMLIDKVLDTLKIRSLFQIVHSAEFEKYGKPEPDIFLSTAKMLNAKPEQCVVFEDAVKGVEAAKNAGMYAIAIPSARNFDNPAFDLADEKYHSLLEFYEKLNITK